MDKRIQAGRFCSKFCYLSLSPNCLAVNKHADIKPVAFCQFFNCRYVIEKWQIANVEEKLDDFTLIKRFGEKEMKENPHFKSLSNDFDIIQATNYFLDKNEAKKVLCLLASISLAKAY